VAFHVSERDPLLARVWAGRGGFLLRPEAEQAHSQSDDQPMVGKEEKDLDDEITLIPVPN